LASATAGAALCKIFQAELPGGYAATKDQASVSIIRNDIIFLLHLERDRRQSFVAHPGDMKMSFALTNQILFAQIGVPALENNS
jgi:hypothetical protein